MKSYLQMQKTIRDEGSQKGDRTGTGTTSYPAYHLRHNLKDGFPLLTTKFVSFKNVITEWKWMMSGMTDVRWLVENGCTIWDEWATPSQCNRFQRLVGDLGPVYGHQWRNFGASRSPEMSGMWDFWRSELLTHPVDVSYDDITNPYEYRDSVIRKRREQITQRRGAGVAFELMRDLDKTPYLYGYVKNGFDQVAWVIKELKLNPDSRRLIVSGWNPKEANDVALPPCHTLWQLQTTNDELGNKILNLMLHQRSADTVLGIPYNIAFYAFMVQFFASMFGMKFGATVINAGDAHLYDNHSEAVETQQGREPYSLPTVEFDPEYLLKMHRFMDSITASTSLRVIGADFTNLVQSLKIGEDVYTKDYTYHPSIKADVAV